jgi:general stress protein 26
MAGTIRKGERFAGRKTEGKRFIMTHTAAEDSREKVWELIKDIKVAMLVTMDEQGHHYARPMVAQEPDEHHDLWFFTSIDSPKIREIETNPEVLLSYADPGDNAYVSISGRAHVVQDRAKIHELWSESLKAWWPDGKDDPDLALICVTPESAEYWDGPASTVVQAFGYLKAKITGEPERMGENRTVRM